MSILGRWIPAVVVLALAMGCTGEDRPAAQPDPAQPAEPATIRVEPEASRMVEPTSVEVSGLRPGEIHTVTLTSTDGEGLSWSSAAEFRSSAEGELSLDESEALGGSYEGVNGMGLLETLQPREVSVEPAFYAWTGSPQTFRLEVVAGEGVVARTEFVRQLGPGVRRTELAASDVGFDGVFHQREAKGAPSARPAVLAFGGSEGGNSMELPGTALAAEGYPTLTLAYFDAPGLPRRLTRIPLEYFARALRWLREQPGVDPRRVHVLGVSRGSEAAQLVAVRYPRLVLGVVAVSPSAVVHPGLTGTSSARRPSGSSAWSFGGEPVPYTRTVNDPRPAGFPDSVIPVEDIDGPVFLACGGADRVWDSCAFGRAIVDRRKANDAPGGQVLARYEAAGHGLGSLVPYDPVAGLDSVSELAGEDVSSNSAARARLWPRLVEFLRTASPTRG